VTLLERIARLCEPGRVRVYPRAVFAMFFALWIGSYALMRESAIVDGWGRFLGNDFMAFYTGAKLWMAGAPDLYDLDAQTSYQIAMAGRELGSVIPFISPPPALWLYLPFAQGGYLGGLLAWWALQLCSAITAAALLRRFIPNLATRLSPAQMAAVCLCTMPTLLWLSYAQATGLVLLIWASALVLLVRGRDTAAGVTLALLAFKPQLALGPALLMLGGRRWRALAAGALTLALIGAASLWMFGPTNAAWLAHGPEFAQMLGAQGYARWPPAPSRSPSSARPACGCSDPRTRPGSRMGRSSRRCWARRATRAGAWCPRMGSGTWRWARSHSARRTR
jgi:hypothetical protein